MIRPKLLLQVHYVQEEQCNHRLRISSPVSYAFLLQDGGNVFVKTVMSHRGAEMSFEVSGIARDIAPYCQEPFINSVFH